MPSDPPPSAQASVACRLAAWLRQRLAPRQAGDAAGSDTAGSSTAESEAIGAWPIVICLALIGLLVLFGLILLPSDRSAPPTATPDRPPERAAPSGAEGLAKVRQSVRGFMEADTHEARARYVIAPTETLPKMAEFYARPENRAPAGFGEFIDVAPTAFHGFPMHMVVATAADGETRHLFSVFAIGEDQRIEWESSVGYSEIGWQDFREQKTRRAAVLRVNLKRGAFYLDPYQDESAWHHYEMRYRDPTTRLDSYVSAPTRTSGQLQALVRPGAVQPVTVKAQWDPVGKAVRIEELVHPYWIDLERLRREADRAQSGGI